MEFWKAALSAGGIGAIGAFLFYNLYKEWIKLPILRDLNRAQKFNLMRLFLILTFGSFVIALGAYIYIESPNREFTESSSRKEETQENPKTINEASVGTNREDLKVEFNSQEERSEKSENRVDVETNEGDMHVSF